MLWSMGSSRSGVTLVRIRTVLSGMARSARVSPALVGSTLTTGPAVNCFSNWRTTMNIRWNR